MCGATLAAVKTVKHYMVLGAYWGAFSLLIAIVRASFELPGKLRGTTTPLWQQILEGIPLLIVIVAGFLLAGALIGGLVGWVKLNAEKRGHAG